MYWSFAHIIPIGRLCERARQNLLRCSSSELPGRQTFSGIYSCRSIMSPIEWLVASFDQTFDFDPGSTFFVSGGYICSRDWIHRDWIRQDWRPHPGTPDLSSLSHLHINCAYPSHSGSSSGGARNARDGFRSHKRGYANPLMALSFLSADALARGGSHPLPRSGDGQDLNRRGRECALIRAVRVETTPYSAGRRAGRVTRHI